MSYTMTLDVPQKTAAYVGARPQLRKELNAIFIAVVAAKMQCEATEPDETPGKRLLASFREGDAIAAGKKKTKWYKSADKLIEDCLA